MSSRSITALLAASIAVLVACGVPTGGSTRTVDPETVPYALLSPAPSADPTAPAGLSPSATATPTTPGTAVASPLVFLVDEDLLVAVPVVDPPAFGDPEAMVRTALTQLSAGPDEDQRRAGLASALGSDVDLRLVDLADGTARVDVVLPSRDPAPDQLPLAVGQIVLTVTSVTGVDDVVLVQDGEEIEMPLPGGARTSDPVDAADYQDLLAPIAGPLTPGPVPTGEPPTAP